MTARQVALSDLPESVRAICIQAAVRERFRPGDLLSAWIEAHPGADAGLRGLARRTALDLQDLAKPALGTDGYPAHRLGTGKRLEILRMVGADKAKEALDGIPDGERTDAERLLVKMLAGEDGPVDVQDRDALIAASQVAPMATALGLTPSVDVQSVRRAVNDLDLLNLVGGPDLHRFVGRTRHLSRLHRLWEEGGFGLVLIQGPGGMGKSLLVSRFVADLLGAPTGRPTALFHIDFDRRDLQEARPASILAEFVRQAPRWLQDARQRESATQFAASLQHVQSQQYQGISRSIESTGGLASSRLEGLINTLLPSSDEPARFIIFADSAEQVFGFDDVAADSPRVVAQNLADALRERQWQGRAPTQVMVIYGSRYFPNDWPDQPSTLIELDAFTQAEARSYLHAEVDRADAKASRESVDAVIRAVGRSPLALRFAARLLAGEDARTDPQTWVEAARNDPERIQATLYDRVIKRLRDPQLRKLAFPGLLLRRLTPAVVARVLAEPCGLDVDATAAEELIERSAELGQLFYRDPSDPYPGAVWHRQDVRSLMLPDLDGTIDPEVIREVNLAAVRFYANRDDDVSRAEELYHRLRLDQDGQDLDSRWTEAAGERLRRAQNEFPARARTYLRTRLNTASLAVSSESPIASAPNREQPTRMGDQRELRGLILRQLQSGEDPIALLAGHRVDSLAGPLADLYAEALVGSGQQARLLMEARALPPAPKSDREIRAAVAAVIAGVLEGKGQLSEALPWWAKARRPTSPEPAAELTQLGGQVGWLRTRRKLNRLSDRSAGAEIAVDLLIRHAQILPSRPVLLRESLAEVGDALLAPGRSGRDIYDRLFSTLLEGEESFPSLIEDGTRLAVVAERLGFGFVDSAYALRSIAVKGLNIDGGRRLVAALREEVDWTLARAASHHPQTPALSGSQGL